VNVLLVSDMIGLGQGTLEPQKAATAEHDPDAVFAWLQG
jgi:hypothetical protein